MKEKFEKCSKKNLGYLFPPMGIFWNFLWRFFLFFLFRLNTIILPSTVKRRDEYFRSDLINAFDLLINEKYPLSCIPFTAAIVWHNRNTYICIYIYSFTPICLESEQREIDSIATSKPHFYWQSRMIWPHFVHFTADATNLFATAWEITSAGNVFVSTIVTGHYYKVQIQRKNLERIFIARYTSVYLRNEYYNGFEQREN